MARIAEYLGNESVAPERTGWRDLALSERHRLWGVRCPALDVDFLLLEYKYGRVVALVEYKHESAADVNLAHPTMRALIDMGDRADLPVFLVRYAGDFSLWQVQPLNAHARRWLPEDLAMSEREWVELLHRIRGYALPEDWSADSETKV